LKVIFCTYDGKNVINGINVWLIRLLPDLKKNGIDINVIAITWAPKDECTAIPILESHGINCDIVDSKRYTEREVRWILDYINESNPDVFVANNMLPAFYASKWIQKANIPSVCVIHTSGFWFNNIKKDFLSKNNDFAFKAIVPVSDYLFSMIKLLSNNSIIKKIPCGVPVPVNKNNHPNKKLFKIAYIGRLAQEEKNISSVIRAFCETVTALPGVEAAVYGAGPDVEIVNQILGEFNYPDRVILKGNLTPAEIQNELSQLHAIVLMSDYEGLPVSLMEAMAFGVVPVCTRIKSGVPELLIENTTGLYIDSPAYLAEKISYLKGDAVAWELLSTNAKNHIEQYFSAQKCTIDWVRLFYELAPAKTEKIKIPRRIDLPAANKGLSLYDNREPGILKKALRRLKRKMAK